MVVPALALVAVTVIGITALLGGLEEAPEAPPQLTSGAVLDQGRYSTRFVESRVRVEPAESTFAEDKRFLELVFDVTNLGDETTPVGLPPSEPEGAATSSFFAGSLVKIAPAFPEDAGPFVFALSKDQDETRQLHPGVTTKVIVRYELKDTERPPEKVTLDVAAFEYGAGFQDPTEKWSMISQEVGDRLVPEIRARVTMPVREGAGA
ncbi:hypothetical protein GCM10012289_26850 [Nonomuraea cavernae]|uniref:DUF4352 domain-containing protein n=1 Tax=Nonomuraea cavernae TaxID=2045107 RepID=A0A918DJE1_9ACTN|nr:hypothetical protein GCM10012289_26850 [Nonomuraea cavernae]